MVDGQMPIDKLCLHARDVIEFCPSKQGCRGLATASYLLVIWFYLNLFCLVVTEQRYDKNKSTTHSPKLSSQNTTKSGTNNLYYSKCYIILY